MNWTVCFFFLNYLLVTGRVAVVRRRGALGRVVHTLLVLDHVGHSDVDLAEQQGYRLVDWCQHGSHGQGHELLVRAQSDAQDVDEGRDAPGHLEGETSER